MKKGVRHTTTEIMSFIRKAEEVGITAACKEYDICYTTGRRWIVNHSHPMVQETLEDEQISLTTEPMELEPNSLEILPEDALASEEQDDMEVNETEEPELMKEYGSLILENERLKVQVKMLSRALAAIASED